MAKTKTVIDSVVTVGGTGANAIKTQDALVALIKRPLGSPINSYKVDETFKAELTGKIEISTFTNADGEERKSAKYLTKKGIKVSVSADFNPSVHIAGYIMDCVCKDIEITRDNGEKSMVKFAQQIVK